MSKVPDTDVASNLPLDTANSLNYSSWRTHPLLDRVLKCAYIKQAYGEKKIEIINYVNNDFKVRQVEFMYFELGQTAESDIASDFYFDQDIIRLGEEVAGLRKEYNTNKAQILAYLRKNVEFVDVRTPDSFTALHLAALDNLCDIGSALLQHGADINAVFEKAHSPVVNRIGSLADRDEMQYGTTALMFAAGRGHLEFVEMLLAQGVNYNQRNNESFTALHRAFWKSRQHVVEILLKQPDI